MIDRVFVLKIGQPGDGEAAFGRFSLMSGVGQAATF